MNTVKQSDCTVWVGTSGYSFYCWEGAFYRTGIQAQEMLPYYSSQFDTVELNYSFYRLPTVKTSAGMVRKTPAGFTFFAKIHQSVSHENDLGCVAAFKEGLEPLRISGKLAGLLLQFPQRFHNNRENRKHLMRSIHKFKEYPLAVEFRHRSWSNTTVNQYLHDHNVSLVAVDVPQIYSLYPKTTITTGDLGYIRLHSRNRDNWYLGGEERYDYNYSQEEMEEWLPVLDAFSERVRNVFVFFNNCRRGQAAANARAMKRIITASGLNVRTPNIDRSAATVKGGLWAS